MRLHLGCGNNFRDGWVNIDISPNVKADIYHDLEKIPWPIAANSVTEIEMFHVLEHLSNTVAVINELYRVMKSGAVCHIQVPYACSVWAYQDPTHVRFFTERTLEYFTKASNYNFYSNARFEIIRVKLTANWNSPTAILRNLIPFRKVLRWFLWNMYDGVDFILRKM